MGKASSVDEYLAAVPKDVRAALEKLRRTIRAAAPKATEVISYQIPTYKYHGPLVHFMAGKNHCSFITPTILPGQHPCFSRQTASAGEEARQGAHRREREEIRQVKTESTH